MGHPRPLYHLFSYYQTNFRSLTTIVCGKILCPSGIRRRDSNPQPLEHESTKPLNQGSRPAAYNLGCFFLTSLSTQELHGQRMIVHYCYVKMYFVVVKSRTTQSMAATEIELFSPLGYVS